MSINEAFDHYMASLDWLTRIAVSRDIRVKCGVSPNVLCAWRRGRTKIKPIYVDKINEILGIDLRIHVGK